MTKFKKIQGVIVPMVTPFTGDGQIDEVAVERITHYLIDHEAVPFVLGTTGEYASISYPERVKLVRIVCKAVQGRREVFAGISSNSLQSAIEMAKTFFDLGVTAVVAHPPYYYPMSDAQILQFYEKLVEAIPGPLVLYNMPITTQISIPLEIIETLSRHEQVVGIKDSERHEGRLKESIARWAQREDFSHLTGWGSKMAEALKLGTNGLVPSTGNIAPQLYRQLYQAARQQDWDRVWQLQKGLDEISSLYQANRNLSQSLAALKVIMNELGLCSTTVLPPLLPLNEEEVQLIRQKFQQLRARSNWPYE